MTSIRTLPPAVWAQAGFLLVLPWLGLAALDGVWISPEVARHQEELEQVEDLKKGHAWVQDLQDRVTTLESRVAEKSKVLQALESHLPAAESDRLELTVRRDHALEGAPDVELIPSGDVPRPKTFRHGVADDVRQEVLELAQRARDLDAGAWVDPQARDARVRVMRVDEDFTLEGPYGDVFGAIQKLEVGARLIQITKLEAQGFTSQDESGSGAQVRLRISSPIFVTDAE